MKKATLVVEGLGTVEVTDLESYEVAESFMKFLRKRVMAGDSPSPPHKADEVSVMRGEPEIPVTIIAEEDRGNLPTLEKMWTAEEKAYLFEHHKSETAEQIGLQLNRSTNAVKSMGYKNGLKFRSKSRMGVSRGAYKKTMTKEYRSLSKRIQDCKPKLVIDKFLEDNPDVKKDTLTSVLARMIKKSQATQISPNEVQVHGEGK